MEAKKVEPNCPKMMQSRLAPHYEDLSQKLEEAEKRLSDIEYEVEALRVGLVNLNNKVQGLDLYIQGHVHRGRHSR